MALAQSPSGRHGDGPHRPARAWSSVVTWRLRRRLPHGTGSAPRAIDRNTHGGVLGVAGACKFLFFLPPARSAPPTCHCTRSGGPASRSPRDPAADTHKSLAILRAVHQALVNNSENTSTALTPCGRSAVGTDWMCCRKRGAGGECSATRTPSKQAEQAAARIRGASSRRPETPAARPRQPPAIANPCRGLLIARLGDRSPGAYLREPVGIAAARHGQGPQSPPRSALKESGERP
jgi:hypothetical protein